ncbi:AtpZ/AtpI family protein [Parvularcula dongshanensis]|uniref:ATP synthase protein I n=1 Tax=Parvularcula dongshanensis TaxID=1173995 RepID=A0A840I1Q5_9PROT|nr:AtpZ/AtpI family protein [Parvularcula dongshanensis]MBB4658749.1 ATP synthase protein I [Parvularcula dongshanensis]
MSEPDPNRPPSSDLDRLGERLTQGRSEAGLTPPPGAQHAGGAVGDGLRIAIEFVVSVLVGAGLGYVLGGLLGGRVIGLLLGLFFGFAAGLRGVYRGMMAGTAAENGTETDEPGRDRDA